MSQRSSRRARASTRPSPPPVGRRGGGIPRRWLYAGVAGIAAAVAVALILVSVLGGGTDTASAKAVDGAPTQALLDGIPQDGATLGSPDAPVTMVVYEDPRCPFCQEWSLATLPTIIEDYVRPGLVKLEYRGIPLLGPASERPLAFVWAAALQDKLWNVNDLLYRHQGSESEDWATDELLRGVGNAIPGFDGEQAFADLDSDTVGASVADAAAQAQADGVQGTPWFLVGPSGGAVETLRVTSLEPDEFTAKLDELLGR